MSVLNGFKKYKNYKADANGDHQLQSFWTSTDTVEDAEGNTLTSILANLPSPMVMKGTLGAQADNPTITALPVDGSATIGDTYKVITDGTYAGVDAKIGDMFTCITKTSSANTWTHIPAGDDSIVIANPSGEATDDLTKVSIDGVVYDVVDADAVHTDDVGTAAAKDFDNEYDATSEDVATGKTIADALGTLGTAATKDTTNSYSGTGTDPITGTGVKAALNTLDVTGASAIDASKTIASWSETDGKVDITTQDIAISKSQVSGLGSAAGKNTTNSYSSIGTDPITGTGVADALGTLDVTGASNIGAGKTISAWSETDGKVSISTQDISITKSQVSDFPSLGTAAAKDVAASGNASATQVVMGNDTRLTNARPSSDVTDTYSATGTVPVSGKAVASAIGGLDVTGASSIAASKTISSWSETDGKVSISTQDIAITSSQVSGLGSAASKNTTDTYSSTGTDPVTGKAVAAAIGTLDVSSVGGTNKYISTISETDGKISATAGTIDTSVTSGSSNLITSGAVYTAIDNLPEPMVFKGSLGTGGTITTLPTAAVSNEGFTYKVITAGTYASQAAKVGDLFISNGSSWIWIPSGDEPSGTVTSVKIAATSPIAIDSDAAITSSGTRTLSHANSGATAGSYGDSSAQTPSYGGTFKVPYVTVNATGHVTSISEHTVKIPASDNTNTHRPIQVNGTQILGDNTTALNLKAGSNVSLSNSSGTVTIAATDTTYSNATQSAAGLMSSTDKTKLDGVAAGATANIGTVTQVKVGSTAYNPSSGVISLPAYPTDTNTHRPIQMNGTEILGNNTTALNLKAGSNVTLTNSSGTVTIAATDTTYGNVSASAAGLAPKGAAVSSQSQSTKFLREDGSWAAPSYTTNTNTTYTFEGGTNKFTVTPSGGSAQTVTVTPSITNNITGSGTSGYIAKFNGANTITNGPAFGSSTSTYLRNDGSWVNPLNLGTGTYIQYTENSESHLVRPTDSDITSMTGHDYFPTVAAVKNYLNSNYLKSAWHWLYQGSLVNGSTVTLLNNRKFSSYKFICVMIIDSTIRMPSICPTTIFIEKLTIEIDYANLSTMRWAGITYNTDTTVVLRGGGYGSGTLVYIAGLCPL